MTRYHICTACHNACDAHDVSFPRKEYELVPHGSGKRVYAIDHREPMKLRQRF